MSNLEDLRVTRAFIPNESFSVIGSLPNLRTFNFINSYTSGDVSTVAVRSGQINGERVDRVPFNPVMNLGALGISNSIEVIEIMGSYLDYESAYQHRVRGILNVEGLANLTSLRELTISEFRAVDDHEMKFVEGLSNLEYLKIVQAPFTNIDSVDTLPETTSVSINNTQVKDYSNIKRTNFNNAKFSHDVFVMDAQPYEVTSDGYTSKYNTKLVIPEGSTEIKVMKGNEVDLESYEIIDNQLYLNVSTEEFKIFNMYNPDTNASDLSYKGFRFGLSYTLANGMNVEYPVLIAEVGEFATFKLVGKEGIKPYEKDIIQVRIDDLGKVKIPSKEDFGLKGYEIDAWYVDEGLSELADFSEKLTEATTFYGKISRIPNKYTVEFESNGGSEVASIEDVLEGSTIIEPTTPNKENHKFIGWYADSELNSPWNFASDLVNDNMTLYAKWEEIEEPTEKEDSEDPSVPINPTDPKEGNEEVKEEVRKTDETPKTGVSNDLVFYAFTVTIAAISLIVIVKEKQRQ